MKKRLLISGLFLLSVSVVGLRAQDFTDIGKRRPFLLSGSAGVQASTRLSTRAEYSDPFGYVINVQLTPSLYGFSMPLSLTFADNRLSYSQPFSRYSLQPTYKWATGYFGRTSMDMHPYGLSGKQFDGAGISLQPKNFPLKFMAMYGRFSKARVDSVSGQAGAAGQTETDVSAVSYKRSGYAFKLDFERKNQQVGLHFFSARDKASSLPERFAGQAAPACNHIAAIDFSFNLYQDLNLYGQAGLSIWKNDLREKSKSLATALKAGVSYKWLSLSYERISPDYQSMGTDYFNRDFENLVLAFSHGFSFMDIRADLGWQHDDLKSDRQNRTDRVVGSVFMNFRIGKQMSASASYSNFTSYTQIKPFDLLRPDEPFFQDYDTVPFRQISQQAQASFSYRTPNGAKYRQEAGVDFSYQSSRLSLTRNYSDYVYATLRHSIVLNGDYRLQSALSLTSCLNSREGEKQAPCYGIGPTVSLAKAFLEKTLQTSASCGYYVDMSGKNARSGVWNMRMGLRYVLRKNHHFDVNISTRLNTAFGTSVSTSESRNRFEFQAQAGYRYQFSLDPFKKKGSSRKRRG